MDFRWLKGFKAVLLLAAVAALSVRAQGSDAEVDRMRLSFQQLNYQAAREAGERALLTWQKLTPQDLIDVHRVLGIIAYSEGNFFEAKAQFEQALSLEPSLTLDSLYVSPKIQQFLLEVKHNFSTSNGHSNLDLRYLVLPDPRPQAALRSLLLPGAGQRFKNQHSKGWLLTAAAGLGILTTAALHLRKESAKENYFSAKSIAKAQSTYSRYNNLNRARNVAAFATGIVWSYAFFDALIAAPGSPQHHPNPPQGFNAEGAVIGLSWQIEL